MVSEGAGSMIRFIKTILLLCYCWSDCVSWWRMCLRQHVDHGGGKNQGFFGFINNYAAERYFWKIRLLSTCLVLQSQKHVDLLHQKRFNLQCVTLVLITKTFQYNFTYNFYKWQMQHKQKHYTCNGNIKHIQFHTMTKYITQAYSCILVDAVCRRVANGYLHSPRPRHWTASPSCTWSWTCWCRSSRGSAPKTGSDTSVQETLGARRWSVGDSWCILL